MWLKNQDPTAEGRSETCIVFMYLVNREMNKVFQVSNVPCKPHILNRINQKQDETQSQDTKVSVLSHIHVESSLQSDFYITVDHIHSLFFHCENAPQLWLFF